MNKLIKNYILDEEGSESVEKIIAVVLSLALGGAAAAFIITKYNSSKDATYSVGTDGTITPPA